MRRILQTTIQAFSTILFVSFFSINPANAQALSGTKTVGSGGTYTTLTAAVTAVTAAGVNGPLVLELLSTYTSSGETFPIAFAAIAGSSATNTITVRPQTGATGLSITSANATATLDFGGCKYIIIDGRPGSSGSAINVANTTYLTIANTNTAGVAIRMINDATYNTVKYCDLQGVNNNTGQVPGVAAGVVFIGTTVGTNGNDNNTIDNCNIHSPSNSTISTMGVYSFGPTIGVISATFNDSNTVSNNNIFDMWGGATLTTAGVECDKGTNAWVISGNSIFQTTTRSPTLTAAIANRGIYINTNNGGGLGNGFTITGNYIGGMAPKCAGSAYTVSSSAAFNALFDGITLNVAGGNTSNVKSNVITNLNLSQGAVTSDLFHGIWCQNAGSVNVGGPSPSDGNIVGSSTATGAITLNSLGAGFTHNPILVVSGVGSTSTNILFQYNRVGGIDLVGAGNGFSGIFCNANAPNVIIDNNLIGSTTVNNSINASSTSGAYVLFVNGIRSPSGSALLTITNNTIANLNNSNTSTTGSSGITNASVSQTAGIVITGAGTATQIVNSISGNIVKNIACAAYQTGNYVNTVLVGIGTVAAGGSPTIISNNIVDSMVNTSTSFGTSGQNILMTGIFFYGSTSSTTIISKNFVHSFDLVANNPGCTFRGIEMIGGPVNCSDNMIRLGIKADGTDLTTPVLIYALLTEGSTAHYLYHNSVYIGGAGVTGTDPTYTYWRYNIAPDDIRNNIFVNNRSNATGATGKHYAMYLTGLSTLTMNNNIYYANGTGGVFAYNGTADVSAYSSGWVTGDANSYAIDPGLLNVTGPAKTLDMHLVTSGNKGATVANTGITDDIDGDQRSSLPDIGADEIPIDIGVVAIDAPTSANFCGQSKPIIVHLKNFGLQPITSAVIYVYVNGINAYSFPWSGLLNPGVTSSAINIGNYNFVGGNYKLGIAANLPSGFTDNKSSNDTSYVSFTVTPTVVPSMSISTPYSTVCLNSSVTFKASFGNGGTTPQFQWKKNSVAVGNNDSAYTTSSLANNDTITCILTSSAACASPAALTSNALIMTVGSAIPPSVTIATNDTNICVGGFSSFKATPVNGGVTPHYQWRKNGTNVGTDSIGYKLVNPNNKDSVSCIMISSLSCASKSADTSKYKSVTVNALVLPSATISVTSGTICAGVMDTFTAAVVNGGTAPVFQWRVNQGTAGTNSNKLLISTLKDKDSVYLLLTSNASCLSQSLVTSNKITMNVNTVVTPTATINASKTSSCGGDTVTFRSVTANGGTSPAFTWFKGSTQIATGADSLVISTLSNGDNISLQMVSNAPCVTPSPIVTSNKILMTIGAYVNPTVTLTSSGSNVCSGTSVKFTANPLNGGTTPHYVWKKNSTIVGTDDTVFTTSTLSSGDSVYVILKGSSPCQTKTADTSSRIIMSVTPSVTPTVVVNTASNSICQNANTAFTTTITNGGSTPHYQWKKNGVNLGTDSIGLVTSSINNKDTVYVILTSNAQCATATNITSNKLLMTVIPSVAASITISEGANNVCAGTPVIFYTTPGNGGITPHYQWMNKGVAVGKDSSKYVSTTLKDNDSVYVLMTSSVQCAVPAIATSNKVVMHILSIETPEVSVKADRDTVCDGTTVNFTATDSLPLSAKKHQWYKNGFLVGTDSLKYSAALTMGDKVICILKANAQCVSKSVDTASAKVIVNPYPSKPVITRVVDTLRTTGFNAYQWYLDGNALAGANAQLYKALQNGSYKVMVTNLGCSTTSDTFGFYHTALNEINFTDRLSLHPNPTNRLLFLDAKFGSEEETIISVFDMTGKEVLRIAKGRTGLLRDEEINLSGLSEGVYMLVVKHGEGVKSMKVMKQVE